MVTDEHARRDAEADQLGRLLQQGCGGDARGREQSIGSPTMAKIVSKIFRKPYRKWTIARRGRRSSPAFFGFRYLQARRHAVPKGIAYGQRSHREQGGRRRRQAAAAGQGGPRRRGRSRQAGPGGGARWTPSRWKRSWPRPRTASRRRRSSWRSRRPPSSSRRARSSWRRSRRRRSGRLVAERAGSQREYDVRTMTLKTTTAGLAEEEGKLQVADAAGRGRRGERGEGPEPHRRRDAHVARCSDGCSIAWPSRARCSPPAARR